MSESIVERLIALGWKEGPGGVLQPAAPSPELRCFVDRWGARYRLGEGYSTVGGVVLRVMPPAEQGPTSKAS
jgi:hypothetical protein